MTTHARPFALCSFGGFSTKPLNLSLTVAFTALVLFIHGRHAAPVVPPDTSMNTLPLAYYGAQFHRAPSNIAWLSRMQIVILMQEDGACWKTCCPQAGVEGQCGPIHNATAIPGCGPECDQHGRQDEVFVRLKALAQSENRRPPHTMLYLNSVYDFPFSRTHGLGNAIDLLDVNGHPHMVSVFFFFLGG